MIEPGPGRYEIREEKGSPRGDLFELEQKTYYHVVDRYSEEIIMTFEALMEATLSRDDASWDNYEFTGAREVIISPDEESVTIRYFDGLEETLPLP